MEFNFKKKFGQNFIRDKNIIKKIVSLADINEESLVIEIGTGKGALTDFLIETKAKILTYEIDQELESFLKNKYKDVNNLNIIFDDFLKRNITEDIKKYNYKNLYIIANLPYYITTAIINKIIDSKINVDKMVLMVQKEVGDRFTASINNKQYSSITVYLNYYFNIKKEFIVKKESFIPKPKIDSVVVSFTKKDLLKLKDEELFFKLVRDSFVFKRKNLKNNLGTYDLSKIDKLLNDLGKNITFRAEQISLEDFVYISNNYN